MTLSWRRQGYEVRELQPGESFKGTYQGQAKIGEKQLDVVTSGKSIFFIEDAKKSEKAYVIEKEEIVLKTGALTTSFQKGDEVVFGQQRGKEVDIQRQASFSQKWELKRKLERGMDGPGF